MKLEITSRDLLRLVDPVIPCACDDAGLPILNALLIETHGKYVTAVATDRFKLGWQRVELGGETLPEFRAVVKVATLKSILALFKATRFSTPELVLTANGGDLTVEQVGGMSIGGFFEARMRFPLEEGEYPKVHSLIKESLEREDDPAPVTFNWRFLSAFIKASGDNGSSLTIKTHPTKPTIVTDNRDFVGIIMPRRSFDKNESGASTLALDDDWLAVLAGKADPKPATKKRTTRKKAGAA